MMTGWGLGSAIRVLPSLTNSATTPSSRRFTSSRKAGGNDHSRPTSRPTFNVITLPPVNRGRQCSRQDDRKGRPYISCPLSIMAANAPARATARVAPTYLAPYQSWPPMLPPGRPQGSPLHILPPINRGRQCTCGSSAATMANRGPNHPRCARHARCSYSREYSIVTRYCTPTSSHVLEKFLLSAENTNFLPERCSHMIISPDICITVEDYLFALGDKSPNTRKSAKRLLRQFLDWCADQ